MNEPQTTPAGYVTFYLDDMFFGIEISEVLEIVKRQEITPVPLAPEEIEGLIDVRGQIVMAINMRRRLGLKPLSTEETAVNIVVRSKEGPLSVVVDAIGDVIEVPRSSYEQPPETMAPHEKQFIGGVCKLDSRLLLVLNTDRLLQA